MLLLPDTSSTTRESCPNRFMSSLDTETLWSINIANLTINDSRVVIPAVTSARKVSHANLNADIRHRLEQKTVFRTCNLPIRSDKTERYQTVCATICTQEAYSWISRRIVRRLGLYLRHSSKTRSLQFMGQQYECTGDYAKFALKEDRNGVSISIRLYVVEHVNFDVLLSGNALGSVGSQG